MKTLTLTREPEYPGYDSLHGTTQDAPDDFRILIDGEPVGGTYWACAITGPGKWASWGPAGYSLGHMTREDAEHAQVCEYATNPSLFDRLNADARAERAAELHRREAERAEAARRRRLGDDQPGPVIWILPACHAFYAPTGEVEAVHAWLAANGIEDLSGWHDARLEQRATRLALVYESVPVIAQLAAVMGNRDACSPDVAETRVATVTTLPPPISVPARPDMRPVFAEHCPARFPLIDFGRNTVCAECTHAAKAVTARQMVSWPCAVVTATLRAGPQAVA